MKTYRISKSKYAHDHTGIGASLYGGRWNSVNKRAIYTSGSIALAALEVIAHLANNTIEVDYSLIIYEIPDQLIYKLDSASLPLDWNKAIHLSPSQELGDYFLDEQEYLCMQVPSVIVPLESNYIINPQHPSFSDSWCIEIIPHFYWDNRLLDKVQKSL